MEGNWQLGSELPQEPMKTGWMHCLHPHSKSAACALTTIWEGGAVPINERRGDSPDKNIFSPSLIANVSQCRSRRGNECTCNIDDHNILAFRCPNISVGDIKMEYMTSYGQ